MHQQSIRNIFSSALLFVYCKRVSLVCLDGLDRQQTAKKDNIMMITIMMVETNKQRNNNRGIYTLSDVKWSIIDVSRERLGANVSRC